VVFHLPAPQAPRRLNQSLPPTLRMPGLNPILSCSKGSAFICEASPKTISGRTRYLQTRLVFCSEPQLIPAPRNVIVISQILADRLAKLQPGSAAVFHANAKRFAASVQVLDQQLAQQLAPVKKVGFAVYHEGYGHFVGRYGLHQVAYVTYSPEQRPGAKHLHELREVLAKEGKCLFMEPYYSVQGMEEMAAALNLRIGLLDPIGNQQVSSYQQLLQQLGQSFLTCLTDRRDR
jgi:zinc transport system substrate-binding protein